MPNADFVVPVEIDGQVHQVGWTDILFLVPTFASSSVLSAKEIKERLGGIR